MKIIYIFIISLLFTACAKETIVEKIIEKDMVYRWKSHPSFTYLEATILNSYASEDSLFMLGRKFNILSDTTKVDAGYCQSYLRNSRFDINTKTPINALFFLEYFLPTNNIGVLPTKNAMYSGTGSYLDMKTIDSTFTGFEFIDMRSGSECIKINNKNQILVPYRSYTSASVLFLLLDVKKRLGTFTDVYLEMNTTKIIKMPFENTTSFLNNLFSNKDYFIANLQNTYKINSDGSFHKIFDGSLRPMFQKNDTLYGTFQGKLYRSVDECESWTDTGVFQNSLSSLFCYFIGNEIIGTNYGQLFHITTTKDGLTVREIDNNGLANNYITSVSKFKNSVFVTSLTGVYYIPYKDFFTYKTAAK